MDSIEQEIKDKKEKIKNHRKLASGQELDQFHYTMPASKKNIQCYLIFTLA